MDSKIICQHDGPTCTITLNRPKKYNAFDDVMIENLTDAFKSITSNTRILILKGNGRYFCAGADLRWMKNMADSDHASNKSDAIALAEMLMALKTVPCPTLALVQGASFGGSNGLIACCDLVIATEATQFSFSEVKLGLLPATIAPHIIQMIGVRAASRYFLTGEKFSARAAMDMGLITEFVEEHELFTRAQDMTDRLLRNAPNALANTKKLIHACHPLPTPELIEQTATWIADARISNEGQEGLSAFFEKRKPNWQTTHTL